MLPRFTIPRYNRAEAPQEVELFWTELDACVDYINALEARHDAELEALRQELAQLRAEVANHQH